MKLAKIDSDPNLARNLDTNAVINTNIAAFEKFKAERLEAREKEQKFKELEDRMLNIENMLLQISSMLKKNNTEEQ